MVCGTLSSAAVSNNQLPSYMSGYLYPLDSKNGVFSYVSKPRKVEIQQIEIENRENIAIKRKFNHKIPCRNNRKRKKVLPTTKQFDCSNQQAVDGRLPKIDQTKNNKFLGTKTATWTSKSAEESLGNKKVPRRDANESIVSSSVDQQTSKELTLMRDHKATTEISFMAESLSFRTIEDSLQEVLEEDGLEM